MFGTTDIKYKLHNYKNRFIDWIAANWKWKVTWLVFFVVYAVFLYINSSFIKFNWLSYILYTLLLLILSLFIFLINKKIFLLNRKFFAYIALLFSVGFYVLYTYDKAFTITEGWYTFYSQTILGGRVPYRDYHFLFPPVYTYFITIIVAIFGPSILVLRIVGAFMLLFSAYILYKILELFLDPIMAAIITIPSMFMMQSANSAIYYYDYTFLYNIANYLGLYFVAKYFKNIYLNGYRKKYGVDLFLSGAFLLLSMLIRQSSGLINLVFAFILVVFLGILLNKQAKAIKSIILYVLGIIVAGIIVFFPLLIQGCVIQCIKDCFFSAVSAKGGLLAELFNWIPSTFTTKVIIAGSLFFVMAFIPLLLLNKKPATNKTPIVLAFITSFLTIAVLTWALSSSEGAATVLPYANRWPYVNSFYFASLLIFLTNSIYLLINAIAKKELHIKLILIECVSGFAFFTLLGCCTSGGTSEGQGVLSLLLILLSMNLIINRINGKLLFRCLEATGVAFFSASMVLRTKDVLYNWWGIYISSISEQTEVINDNEITKNVKATNAVKSFIEQVEKDFKTYYNDGDTFYCFCRVPIMYSILDAKPMDEIKALVPWFDVSTQEVVKNDFDYLQNNNPDIVFLEQIPDWTISGHENSFLGGNKSVQREIIEYFNGQTSLGLYTCVGTYNINPIGDGYYFSLLVLNN